MNFSIADIFGTLLSLVAFGIFMMVFNELSAILAPSLGPLEKLVFNLFPAAILVALMAGGSE